MNTFLCSVCIFLLAIQADPVAGAGFLQANGSNPQQEQRLQRAPLQAALEDGTPVELRISQTVSSADAHVNDPVEFEVSEDVVVSGVVIIPRGAKAWGTVTEAKHKRRLGRGGKLEIVMTSVELADGEKAPLRATKEAQGGSHAGVMTAGIVAAGVIFWPVAPAFLFIHGKDITIAKGTAVPTFINGNLPLDLAKFQQSVPGNPQFTSARSSAPPENQTAADAQIEITSTPPGADIEIDGSFVGSTPSTVGVVPGEHTVVIKKDGAKPWERNLKVTTGKIAIAAQLEMEPNPNQNSR
jgi:hypothetical protein